MNEEEQQQTEFDKQRKELLHQMLSKTNSIFTLLKNIFVLILLRILK